MKKSLLIFICLIALANVKVKGQVYYYLKADGFVMLEKDSADFIRVVGKKDAKTKMFPIIDYYKSGAIKARGTSLSDVDIKFEGQLINYFEDGKKKQIVNFENGYTIGEIFEYYPNGQLYIVFELISAVYGNRFIKLKQANDSTGKATVVDGKGYFLEYNDDFTNVEAEGSIQNFSWDGPVKGFIKAYGISYNEVYQDGKLLAGRAKDKDGNLYTYKREYNPPNVKEDNISFDSYVFEGIKAINAKNKVKVKSPFSIRFTVEKDGKLANVYMPKSISPEVDDQIKKLFLASPQWMPGIKKGVPITTIRSITFTND